jgi:hypothetical protein
MRDKELWRPEEAHLLGLRHRAWDMQGMLNQDNKMKITDMRVVERKEFEKADEDFMTVVLKFGKDFKAVITAPPEYLKDLVKDDVVDIDFLREQSKLTDETEEEPNETEPHGEEEAELVVMGDVLKKNKKKKK